MTSPTGLGAKRGVLFKNAAALGTSARIDTVVMDKTGTPTKGEPEVTDVAVEGIGEEELLSLAAAVEAESEHRSPPPSSRTPRALPAGTTRPWRTASTGWAGP